MIQDQIKFASSSSEVLRMKCYLCKNLSHCINNCPLLHFYPDREKVIKAYDYPFFQKRKTYQRLCKKKEKTKILKNPLYTIKKQELKDFEHEKVENKLLNQNNICSIDSELKFEEEEKNEENIIKSLTSIKNEENKKFSPKSSEGSFTDKSKIHKKATKICIEKDFERLFIARKYFPLKNFSNFKAAYQIENVAINSPVDKEKKWKIKKISKFTFYPEKMLELLEKKTKKLRSPEIKLKKGKQFKVEDEKFSLNQINYLIKKSKLIKKAGKEKD